MYQITLLKSGFGFRSTVPDQHSGSEAAVCTDGGAGGEVRLLLSDLFFMPFSCDRHLAATATADRRAEARSPSLPVFFTAGFILCFPPLLSINIPLGFLPAGSQATPRNRTAVVWEKLSKIFCPRIFFSRCYKKNCCSPASLSSLKL